MSYEERTYADDFLFNSVCFCKSLRIFFCAVEKKIVNQNLWMNFMQSFDDCISHETLIFYVWIIEIKFTMSNKVDPLEIFIIQIEFWLKLTHIYALCIGLQNFISILMGVPKKFNLSITKINLMK